MLVCDCFNAHFPVMTSAKLHWSVADWDVCMAAYHLIALPAHPHRHTSRIAAPLKAYVLTYKSVKHPLKHCHHTCCNLIALLCPLTGTELAW